MHGVVRDISVFFAERDANLDVLAVDGDLVCNLIGLPDIKHLQATLDLAGQFVDFTVG